MGPRNVFLGGWRRMRTAPLDFRLSSLWGHEMLSWMGETHASAAGAFGGAPYGATKCCPERGGRTRPPSLGPSVELPMGPRNV